MSQAWVSTLSYDHLGAADLASGSAVLAQLPVWVKDYTPHSTLGYQPPAEARQQQQTH